MSASQSLRDPDEIMAEQMARFKFDPLGYVRWVFDWGYGDLAGEEGPDQWQSETLREIGEALKESETACRMAIASGHGIGKALHVDEPVLTPAGWQPIGSLRRGDLVATVDGSFTPVIGVFPQGERDLFRVTMSDGCSVLADAEHLWETTTRGERKRDKPAQVRTTKEIAETLTFPNGPRQGWNHRLPRLKPIQHPPAALPLDPYVLGLLLGDGDTQGRLSCSREEEILPYAIAAGATLGVPQRGKSGTTITFLGAKPALRALGLLGCRSYEKFIPRGYMAGSIAQRTALLQGILDTDGTVGKGTNAIVLDITAPRLADDVAELVRSLGGGIKRSTKKGMLYGVEKRLVYRLYITMPREIAPFRFAAKANKYQPQHDHFNRDRGLSRFIVSVEPAGRGEAVCIAVDHPSHLYVTRDHIVTHNTCLTAWIIHWFAATRPGCAGVVTANTADQLKNKTWRELSKWNARAINGSWFEWTATSFKSVERPDTWFIAAQPWSKERSEAFAGLHEKDVLVLFDEASAIDDVIWEVAEGAMTEKGALWLALGNPTRNSGRFRECWGKFRNYWRTKQIDSRTAARTNKAEIEQYREIYGEDSDFFRVRVRGMWPRSSSMQFIPSDVVERAMTREAVSHTWEPLIMGVDVARFGDDQTVIAFRRGRDAASIPWVKYRNIDTMTLASEIARMADQERVDAIFVDGVGIGAGVVDRLRQLKREVFDVQSGSKPSGFLAGEPYRVKNKRAEMWAAMRNWMSTGMLPDDNELEADLIGVEYGYDADNAIQLERKDDMKKRGLASPDSADALALTFAEPVAPKSDETAVLHQARQRNVKEYDPFGPDAQ